MNQTQYYLLMAALMLILHKLTPGDILWAVMFSVYALSLFCEAFFGKETKE